MNLHTPQPVAESVEAEQQVLGALLLDQSRVSVVELAGGSDLFHDPVHAALYSLIRHRDRQDMLASPVALTEWANSFEGMKDLGGSAYLARLAGSAVSSSRVGDYCSILADLNHKRKILEATDAARDAIRMGDESSGAIAGRLEASLAALSNADGPQPVSMMKATTLAVQQALDAKNGVQGAFVRTGIHSLDAMMTGLYPGELILLGGRPSMGKTSVALNIALNAARDGQGVVICSLEMNPEAMALRALSEQTAQAGRAISYRDIRQGNMTDTQLETMGDAAKQISELPIMFLSREYADLGAMLAGAKQASKRLEGGMKLLVIDYAQLLRAEGRGRYEQITEISIALKALAGRMNVPVLALSQLSRGVEQREEKRPMLSDLRESGQLEQDADAVLFCYRDEYYLERDRPEEGNAEAFDAYTRALERSRNKLEIIVAKQRQGPIGTANVMCNVALNRIWER